MKVRLYTIPGSHPGMAIQAMLKHKQIAFHRTDLMPMVSKAALRLLGFPGPSVPAAKIDGRRVQGSIAISHALDRSQPEPPLYPADPSHRTAVEQVETFCDVGLQHPIRQAVWWAFRRDHEPMRSFSEGSRLGLPIGLAVKTAGPIVAASVRYNRATDANVRNALAGLPGMLNRLDDLIEEGTLGGEMPTAADFQVAANLRLAMTMDDLRPFIESRPCGRLALELIPDYPGRLPAALPHAWLEPLREAAVSPGP